MFASCNVLRITLVAAIVAAGLTSTPSQAQWAWKDNNGRVVYSDRPRLRTSSRATSRDSRHASISHPAPPWAAGRRSKSGDAKSSDAKAAPAANAPRLSPNARWISQRQQSAQTVKESVG